MAARSTPPPTGASGSLRAAPSLVFEIKKTIGLLDSSSFGRGYTHLEVTVLSDAGLAMQRTLGPEAFGVLLTLALSAREDPAGLVIDDATALLVEQMGWGRQKCSRQLTELCQLGFIRREQSRVVGDDGKLKYAAVRTWLVNSLYQTVERRLTSVESRAVSGVAFSVDADRDTGTPDSADAISVGGVSVDANRDSGSETAGQSADAFSVSGRSRQHHEDDDDYELHSSPEPVPELPAALVPRLAPEAPYLDPEIAALKPSTPSFVAKGAADRGLTVPKPARTIASSTVADVSAMTDAQKSTLLKSWRVYDADSLIERMPPRMINEAIATISSRWAQIENHGAYLRRLLTEAKAGARSAPALPPAAVVVASEANAAEATPPAPDFVPASALEQALEQLDQQTRADVELHVEGRIADSRYLLGRGDRIVAAARADFLKQRLVELGVLQLGA